MPKASLKACAKWCSETPLTSASRLTGQDSCEAASMRSLARSRRRSKAGDGCSGGGMGSKVLACDESLAQPADLHAQSPTPWHAQEKRGGVFQPCPFLF